MELPDRDERGVAIAGDGLSQQAPVPGHCFAVVGGRKSQIQLTGCPLGTIGTAGTAAAGAESVPEPAHFFPTRRRERFHAIVGHVRRRSSDRKFLRRGTIQAHLAGDSGGFPTPVAH